jgi:hypothetical protein
MSFVKKIAFLAAVIVVALTDAFVYMNNHCYHKSASQEGAQKIASLEKSNKYFPLNDLSYYELGKLYYNLADKNLSDPGRSESYFRESIANLRRAILINPSSPYSHFYYGQALSQLGMFSPGAGAGFLAEFRKAAKLAGDDSQILGAVGLQFISHWADVSQDDRDFAIEVLKKSAAKRDEAQLAVLINAWELNVGDYELIERILPSNSRAYRFFARFLGERSLSLQVRQKYLTKAEFLDFSKARQEFQAGELGLFRLQVRDALTRFQAALDLIRGLRFYQALTSDDSIGKAEYSDLLKSSLIDLVKCRIEQRAKLNEFEDPLLEYLALETLVSKISELDAYLRGTGVLPEKFDRSVGDFRRLYIELFLLYKQTKYREIIDFGRTLDRSLLVVPEAQRPDYPRVLDIIGDSLQKVDYLYDAKDIYHKAKEIDPLHLETLVRIRDNCIHLNDDSERLKNEQDIEKVITPREVIINNDLIAKGQRYAVPLVFDGRKIALDLSFAENKEVRAPLVSVFFNGRVVWEDYLKNNPISLSLETKIGQNDLQIIPVNRSVTLRKLTYRFNGNEDDIGLRR